MIGIVEENRILILEGLKNSQLKLLGENGISVYLDDEADFITDNICMALHLLLRTENSITLIEAP